jgi:hypothetical protein
MYLTSKPDVISISYASKVVAETFGSLSEAGENEDTKCKPHVYSSNRLECLQTFHLVPQPFQSWRGEGSAGGLGSGAVSGLSHTCSTEITVR